MEIIEVDKEVNELIAKHSIYGAEVIVNALVRAMKSRDAFAKIGAGAYGPALIRLVIAAIRREDEGGANNG